MEKLTDNILSTLFKAIKCQASLEAVLKIFIVNYPKYLKKYYSDLRYQAIAVGLVQYKDCFEFELLVDDCQRKCYYPMMSLLYSKYQQATSLAEQLWYKNKIRSQFRQYVRNDKQFEELNEYFLDESESSSLGKLTSIDDFPDEEVEELVKKITDAIEDDYFNNLNSSSKESESEQHCNSARTPTPLETKTTQLKASKTKSKKLNKTTNTEKIKPITPTNGKITKDESIEHVKNLSIFDLDFPTHEFG